jgi:DNA polymerase III subunit chi
MRRITLMSRVDFYLLKQSGPVPRQSFACRLAEKAYRLEHTVHIHAGTPADAERIDELLWTFRDGSFVPHDLISPGNAETVAPVTIGYDPTNVEGRDLLINLADEVPACAEAFSRVAELVTADEDCKQQSRLRFIEYRDRGHTLETHNV